MADRPGETVLEETPNRSLTFLRDITITPHGKFAAVVLAVLLGA